MKSGKTSPVFLLLSVGLLGAIGFLALNSAGHVAQQGDVQARTARWLEEIEAAIEAQPCPVTEGRAAHREAVQVAQSLPIWQERERVDAAQTLRSWRSVEVAFKCVRNTHSQGAAQSQGAVQSPGAELFLESVRQLEREQVRLKSDFSDQLRSWHAALVRAQETGRDEEIRRAMSGLLLLISDHPGRLKGDLERHLRQSEKQKTE